jgi:hypothetical protein
MPLQDALHDCLADCTTAPDLSFSLCLVHVASFTTDEGFIGLYSAIELAE